MTFTFGQLLAIWLLGFITGFIVAVIASK